MVIPARAMKGPSAAGSLPRSSSMMQSVAPCLRETKMSRMDRSKWNGAWAEKRSSARGVNVSEHQSTNVVAFSCVRVTPLGRPVEPDVKRM